MSKTPDYIVMGDDSATITLSDGKTTITMREPTVLDSKVANKGSKTDAEIETTMMGNLCELTPADIDKLTLKNYRRLQAAFMLFTD